MFTTKKKVNLLTLPYVRTIKESRVMSIVIGALFATALAEEVLPTHFVELFRFLVYVLLGALCIYARKRVQDVPYKFDDANAFVITLLFIAHTFIILFVVFTYFAQPRTLPVIEPYVIFGATAFAVHTLVFECVHKIDELGYF